LKAEIRRLVMRHGRKIILQVQKLMGRYSLIGDHQFFAAEAFPWSREIEANWQTIRQELNEVMLHIDQLPNFQDISPDQKKIATDDKWKTFFFFAYGLRSEDNLRRCPQTARLLGKIPGAKTAFFSILTGRKHIPEHCGPYKGVIRYHLGLIVPKEKEACRIRVGDTIAHWDEGKSLFFDDTFPHEVWNDTDSMRVVLFMDILRPLPAPVALLNDLIIKIIAASPFIRDAKKNHDEWEKRMAALWN
jgi:aspartyl/asparaginyl beta-hydroxylase (cupin superfamily)